MQFKNVLCVVDTGDVCENTLALAVSLVEQSQGKLTIMAITEHASKRTGKKNTDSVSIDSQFLNTLVGPYQQRIEIKTKVALSKPLPRIVREVVENKHDLVVKKPDSKLGIKQFRSNTDRLLFGKCRCSVWFNNPNPSKSKKNILAVIDISDESLPAELVLRRKLNQIILENASSIALSGKGKLHIMQAWHLFGESALRSGFIRMPEGKVLASLELQKQKHAAKLDKLMGHLVNSLGKKNFDTINPQMHLVKGAEQNEVPALAKQIEADLVIMGTILRHGVLGYLMGNDAKAILQQLDSSLLVIKQPDFESSDNVATPV